MDACLYDPRHGFYTAGVGVAGIRGDFITSVEIGPLFGAVTARWLDQQWGEQGNPTPFVVADVGAGPGTWARTIRAARPRCGEALELVLVEPSPMARERHDPTLARSVADLAEVGSVHVVMANELLDNLPVRLLRSSDGHWEEAWVTPGTDGPREEYRPLRPLPPLVEHALHAVGAGGGCLPGAVRAVAWVDEARSHLRPGGRLLVLDYGDDSEALAARPRETWLRTYREQRRGSSPLSDPGLQDITCEVPIDQLPEPELRLRQEAWLRRWGIDELVEEGRRTWAERAGLGDLAALRARSRIREAEALLDIGGLGAFWVLEWGPTTTTHQ